MSNARPWLVFAVCSVFWLAVSVELPPNLSGEDVYIFRDAGWNLAASGSFASAGLVQMRDLSPRLYAHYTPLMPLLFAAYAAVLPRNAYAGTVFNLLLGLAAAAVALACALRQPAGRLRTLAALLVAALPIVFITYDRPEALGLILGAAAIASAAQHAPRPALTGALLGITFLAHPFAAAAAALLAVAMFLAANWPHPDRWLLTARQTAIAAAISAAIVAPVAIVFYALDHDSLHRFAGHALGIHSGLGVAVSHQPGGGFLTGIRKSAFGAGIMDTWSYLLSVVAGIAPALWLLLRRKELGPSEQLALLAVTGGALAALFLFPGQRNYTTFIAFLVPIALLLASRKGERLAAPALALLLFAISINLPPAALVLLRRAEQRASYQAAKQQPAYLALQLSDHAAIVAVEGDSYDLFKPEFPHMVRVDEVDDRDHFAKIAAVANCYDAFQGGAGISRNLPSKLNAAEFRLLQPDPEHTWVTLFGHRLMRAQWGYGCDLYLRDAAPAAAGEPEGIQVKE